MNKIELEEEKVDNGIITHLKINEAEINNIEKYEIIKEEIDCLSLVIKFRVDPRQSRIRI